MLGRCFSCNNALDVEGSFRPRLSLFLDVSADETSDGLGDSALQGRTVLELLDLQASPVTCSTSYLEDGWSWSDPHDLLVGSQGGVSEPSSKPGLGNSPTTGSLSMPGIRSAPTPSALRSPDMTSCRIVSCNSCPCNVSSMSTLFIPVQTQLLEQVFILDYCHADTLSGEFDFAPSKDPFPQH